MPRPPSHRGHDDMSIGEVAQLAGVRASALRYYESEGLIAPARRVRGRRRFDRAVLDRLAIIATAQRVGFTIAEVKQLLAGIDANRLSKSWKSLAADKLDEIAASIRSLRSMQRLLREALDCGCADVAACVRAIA